MTRCGETVVLLEDDPYVRGVIRTGLRARGYEVHTAESAAHGLLLVRTLSPDLLILDLGLPDTDGSFVVRSLRRDTLLPIIVLSARDEDREKAALLDLGADDYLTKPFGMPELHARMRVALRRMPAKVDAGAGLIRHGPMHVDLHTRRAYAHGREVRLTRHEFTLLVALLQSGGRVMTHRALLHLVWGDGHDRDTQYLRVYMGKLRKKLERDPARPEILHTESGVGYRIAPEAETLAEQDLPGFGAPRDGGAAG